MWGFVFHDLDPSRSCRDNHSFDVAWEQETDMWSENKFRDLRSTGHAHPRAFYSAEKNKEDLLKKSDRFLFTADYQYSAQIVCLTFENRFRGIQRQIWRQRQAGVCWRSSAQLNSVYSLFLYSLITQLPPLSSVIKGPYRRLCFCHLRTIAGQRDCFELLFTSNCDMFWTSCTD